MNPQLPPSTNHALMAQWANRMREICVTRARELQQMQSDQWGVVRVFVDLTKQLGRLQPFAATTTNDAIMNLAQQPVQIVPGMYPCTSPLNH